VATVLSTSCGDGCSSITMLAVGDEERMPVYGGRARFGRESLSHGVSRSVAGKRIQRERQGGNRSGSQPKGVVMKKTIPRRCVVSGVSSSA